MARVKETAEKLIEDAAHERCSPDDFYVSTYCNFAHSRIDGEPINHECISIHPAALTAEAEAVEDWVEVFHYIQRIDAGVRVDSRTSAAGPSFRSEGGMIELDVADEQRRLRIAQRILNERNRHLIEEGFTATHDDQWDRQEMARAAAAYASPDNLPWPWDRKWDKRTRTSLGRVHQDIGGRVGMASTGQVEDRKRELIKAGALIIAEIERIDRMDARNSKVLSDVVGGKASTQELLEGLRIRNLRMERLLRRYATEDHDTQESLLKDLEELHGIDTEGVEE